MEEIFKTKVRMVGTSFGVLIPKKLVDENKIKLGEEIEVALLKRAKIESIEQSFGITKGAKGFVRDNQDRV